MTLLVLARSSIDMLAHLKAKQRDTAMPSDDDKTPKVDKPPQEPSSDSAIMTVQVDSSSSPCDAENTQMTCDVLCSLSTCSPPPGGGPDLCMDEMCEQESGKSAGKGGPKQHGQLPMFLSSEFAVD